MGRVAAMRTEAPFPGVAAKAGNYESFYIKATRPGGGEGLWIRYTVHKRPDTDPTASLWLTYFDAEAAGPQAAKSTVDASALSTPEGAFIRIRSAPPHAGPASGAVHAPEGPARS